MYKDRKIYNESWIYSIEHNVVSPTQTGLINKKKDQPNMRSINFYDI